MTSNSGAALKGAFESIVNLEREIIERKKDKKEFLRELRITYKLPAASLMQIAKQGAADMKDVHTQLEIAAKILGFPAYTKPADLSDFDHGFADDVAELAVDRMRQIHEIEDEIEGLKADIKAHYEEVQEIGYSPRVVKKLVAFALKPKRRAEYDADRVLLEEYEQILA